MVGHSSELHMIVALTVTAVGKVAVIPERLCISKSDKTWDDLGRIGGLCNLESQQAMSYMTLHLLRSAWYFIAIVALDYNLEDPMPM